MAERDLENKLSQMRVGDAILAWESTNSEIAEFTSIQCVPGGWIFNHIVMIHVKGSIVSTSTAVFVPRPKGD